MSESKKEPYDHAAIEKKWRERWAADEIYATLSQIHGKRKSYILDMFPYPSGEGLHVGHPKGYIATDIYSRMKRMQGDAVLHPMGWDAFGLPAENYAIKNKVHPREAVEKNIARYKEQLSILGLDYDWSREINTTDPEYYRWTQWIFLQMFKHGIVYESYEPINWCPSCLTGLANEDVENGLCERCGTKVEKRPLRQWKLRITDYADRLLASLDERESAFISHIVDRKNPPREGKKTVSRNTIHAIVWDQKKSKVLGLRWKNHDWNTFIVGGIENGEDPVKAAMREVAEETGYVNIAFKKFLGAPVKAEYFAAHKDENRVATTTGILFELVSEEKKEIDDEEKKKHEPVWINVENLNENFFTCAELPVWLAHLDFIGELTFINASGTTTGDDHVRPELPFVERNAVIAIVKHWSEDKFIGLEWKKVAWKTLITGGPDGGESAHDAARKEIIEETGYQNMRLVKKLGRVHAKFFHVTKGVNRHAHFDIFYFELQNSEQKSLSDEEKANHDIVWVPRDEMFHFLGPEAHRYAWAKFLSDEYAHRKPLLDWPESIKESQRNWIGRSEGVNLRMKVKDLDLWFEMYDSIPQTHCAQTFTVIASDHVALTELVRGLPNEKEVLAFAKKITEKRSAGQYEKIDETEGIFTGRFIEYPPTGKLLPIWVASFVVTDYGTGVVNCSAHDERDFIFAKKYGIELHPVLFPNDPVRAEKVKETEIFYREPDGILSEPKEFAGKRWDEAREGIISYLVERGWAKRAVNYRLKDWVFSRQRYWGEPIPLVHCTNCRQKKTTAIIVHGIGEHGNKWEGRDNSMHWIPWLKEELERRMVVSVAPQMPHPWAPLYEEWKVEFEKNEVNEESLLVGHSAGGAFLVRWLTETGRKIKKLILMAPARIPPDEGDQDACEAKKKFYLGYEAGKINADEIVMFRSADDEPRLVESSKYYEEVLRPRIYEYDDKGHFTFEDMRTVEFPELLREALTNINLNPGVIAVPESDLPVELPEVDHYEPTGTGESPLANMKSWVNTTCSECGGPAKRETNTMPQWAGSSWYHLAYAAKANSESRISNIESKFDIRNSEFSNEWLPVDFYVGGAEHATRHLIYARFWHKFLFDIGIVEKDEPFQKLQHVGLISGPDGRKMSKRFGNVVNPDEMVRLYGADTFRMYEMFLGPFDQQTMWNTDGMIGPRRFIERVWKLGERATGHQTSNAGRKSLHIAIKKVTEDIQLFHLNTAISALMVCMNSLEAEENISRADFVQFLKILAPFVPHVSEELWHKLGGTGSIHISKWPAWDDTLLEELQATYAVQIDGKLRATFTTVRTASEDTLMKDVMALREIKKWTDGRDIVRFFVVPNKIISIVTRSR